MQGDKWKMLFALSSSFFITMFAIMGDKGEPFGVPNICWYMVCWKVKEVELKKMSNASINSGTLSVARPCKWELLLSLSNTICFARSSGMVVKRLTTSNDTCLCELLILKSLILLTNSVEFLVVKFVLPLKRLKIRLWYLGKWCVVEPINNTIGLKGTVVLRVFGIP